MYLLKSVAHVGPHGCVCGNVVVLRYYRHQILVPVLRHAEGCGDVIEPIEYQYLISFDRIAQQHLPVHSAIRT
jgi:hypothetical protein